MSILVDRNTKVITQGMTGETGTFHTQQALAYARERKQGRAPGVESGSSPIIAHPDVKRMLLTMRALTRAARALSYATAVAIDRAQRSPDAAARQAAQPAERRQSAFASPGTVST